ncbi:MAG: S9 family peptidase [Chloroflexi bacterium]|nr:S9 family peptidase [Chloroflexota bacterium]
MSVSNTDWIKPTALPPIAPRRPHTIVQHGETRVDDYYWLRQREDPTVIAYLKAENAYTEQMMAHTLALQEQLYAEMKGRIQEIDLSVPEKIDDYFYYTRMEQGQQYPIHCRKRASLDAPEQVLLDENRLAKDQAYFRVGAIKVSPDHCWLAYSTDTTGGEAYTLFILNLDSGELLAEQIPNTSYSVEWANDNRTLYYNVLDAAKRPYRLYRHTLGTDPAQDTLVYHETDEAFFVWVGKTSSKAYLLLLLSAGVTSEVRFAPADQPEAEFKILQPRQHEVEYAVAHHGNRFLVLTNEGAPNFKLMEAPIAEPHKTNWRELIPHHQDILIEGIHVFRDFLVRFEREAGLKCIRISTLNSDTTVDAVRDVTFPEPTYTFNPGMNADYNARTLRFTYSSPVTPNSVIDHDMATGNWDVKKQDEIPSGYNPSQYRSERLMVTAPDGKQVPISLVYNQNLFKRDGSNPMLLTAYGSYGYSYDPSFDAKRMSLLDRGVSFAVAHIRGGSEMGRAWFEEARLLHKKNSFSDFIACAEHLIAQGYTSRDRLAILGGSAGGLLMGAVTNMRPDLFHTVIADVPFVDVISTMSDPTIPLTVIEYDQWGNPADKASYDYMKSYSPYDNVTAQAYPHMLITGGLDDPRVQYWEPAKWAARLRAVKTDDHLLLLKINMDAGHAGPSGRYSTLREWAFKYAFVLDRLGLGDPSPSAAPATPPSSSSG